MKQCAFCQKDFVQKRKPKKEHQGRFCGTSCSAKWRMTQPEIRKKIYTQENIEKTASKLRGRKRPQCAERMRLHNPMWKEGVKEKVRSSLLAKGPDGWKPSIRCGNGYGPTGPEQVLLMLLHGVKWNIPVQTKKGKGSGYPTVYKIDLGFPELKLGIEVDGQSHNSLARQAQDKKKDDFLHSLGWRVLRFKNKDILEDTQKIISTILEWKDTQVSV